LSSFTETQHLASPTLSDISDYRSYLDTQQPIAEIETRFLDASEDLVTLAPLRYKRARLVDGSPGLTSPSSSTSSSGSDACLSSSPSEEPMDMNPMGHSENLFPVLLNKNPPSPTPSSTSESSESSALSSHSSRATTAIFEKDEPVEKDKVGTVCASSSLRSHYSMENMQTVCTEEKEITSKSEEPTTTTRTALASEDVLHLVIAMSVAVLVPVLTFTWIPGVAGRMAVVLLVAFTVFAAQVQAGTVRVAHDQDMSSGTSASGRPGQSSRDLLFCAAVYGAVMAVVASVCA
jgi:hypothetical protein